MAESTCVDLNSEPPIEDFVEKIPQPMSVSKDFYINEFNGKRIKMESEDHDAQSIPYYSTQLIEDDCETFGRSVAAQLRQMQKMQKLLSQRLISEICFRGQIQALQMNTAVTLQTNLAKPNQNQPFANVRSYYNNAPDYAAYQNNVVHQQIRIPANIIPASAVHYHSSNFVNNLQQPSQKPTSAVNKVSTPESGK